MSNIIMTKLNKHIVLLRKKEKEEEFEIIEGDNGYLFGLVWELTQDVWAFYKGKEEENVEQRLQRNVTNLIRRKC